VKCFVKKDPLRVAAPPGRAAWAHHAAITIGGTLRPRHHAAITIGGKCFKNIYFIHLLCYLLC
jgi:hypothetical protein